MAFRTPSKVARLGLPLALAIALSMDPAASQSLSIPSTPSAPPGPGAAALAPLFEVASLALRELAIVPVPGSAEALVEIEAGGATWTLLLEPHTIRSDGFQVLVDDGSGALAPHPEPAIATLRGSVIEVPGSRVRASRDGEQLRALIHAAGETWVVQPAADAGIPLTGSWHVIHRAADALLGAPSCAATGSHAAAIAGGAIPFVPAIHLAEIAADADFEFYALNGASVDDTVRDIEAVLNAVDGLSEADPISLAYELTAVVVRTADPDPYGAEDHPGALLAAFDAVWSGSPESAIPRDLAHLFTGVVLQGAAVGTSNLSEVCTADAYGLSRSRFTANWAGRVALTAHELGHNWSAAHCDGGSPCRILCSSIGGCDGLSPLAYEPASAAAIAAHRGTVPCLATLAPPRSLPILDEFTASAIDPLLWIHVDGAIISSQGVGEPSAPNSLSLDATGPGPYDRDEIRSNRILLAGASDPVLGYSVEHRGVEAGEALVVEVLDQDLHWQELERIVSDGIDRTAYVPRTHLLPPDVRHDRFRVRFRAEVDSPDDDWYIDDLTLVAGGAVFIRGDANGDGTVDIGDPVAILAHLFAAAPSTCLDALDANDDGAVDIADPIALLAHLFSAGAAPPSPHPAAGADPTADPLGCGP